MNSLISIVIPLYNKKLYVKRCIESVISQTYKNIEIIVIDDGSTDNSVNIIENITDNRIKIISIENSGVSTARNKGIDIANGEYITFIDPDDYVDKFYISSMVKIINNNIDLVIAGRIDLSEKEEFLEEHVMSFNEPKTNLPKEYYSRGFCHPVWAKLYRLSIIKENKICFIDTISEDSKFNLDYLNYIEKRVVCLAEAHYFYIQYTSSNLTSRANITYLKQYEKIYYGYVKFFKSCKYDYSKYIMYPQFYNMILKLIKKMKIKELYFHDIFQGINREDLNEIFSETEKIGGEKVISYLIKNNRFILLKILLKFLEITRRK